MPVVCNSVFFCKLDLLHKYGTPSASMGGVFLLVFDKKQGVSNHLSELTAMYQLSDEQKIQRVILPLKYIGKIFEKVLITKAL